MLSTVVGTTHNEEVGDLPSFARPPDSVYARTSHRLSPTAFEHQRPRAVPWVPLRQRRVRELRRRDDRAGRDRRRGGAVPQPDAAGAGGGGGAAAHEATEAAAATAAAGPDLARGAD